MSTESKPINIQITVGGIIKILAVLLGAYLLFLIKDIVLVVITAVVFASAIEPLTKIAVKRMPRPIAVMVIYAGLISLLVGIFYVFVPVLLKDVSDFLNKVPQYVDSVSLWNPLQSSDVEQSKMVAQSLSNGINQGGQVIHDITSNSSFSIRGVVEGINNTLSNASFGFIQTISSVFGGVLSFILIIVLSFYLSIQENGVEKFLRIVTPLERETYVIDLWKRVKVKIGLWMQGQLLLGLLVGVFVYVGLLILGVRNALLFAVFAGVLELIPLFGPIIAAIPAIITGYVDGGATTGIFVLGFYVIIHQLENHLIYPLVVTKIVGVPPILVILSLIVGGKLAGFLGIILSIPVSTLLIECINDVERRKIAKSKS